MRISTLGLMAVAASVATAQYAQNLRRQNFGAEPSCATYCLSSAIVRASCGLNDEGCQCGTGKAVIGGYAASCLLASCTVGNEILTVESVGNALCSAYSSSLSLTAPSSANATMTSATTTGQGATTTGTSTGSITNSLAKGSGAVTATPSASAAQSSSTSKAGGNTVGVGLGGVAGLVLGVAAVL